MTLRLSRWTQFNHKSPYIRRVREIGRRNIAGFDDEGRGHELRFAGSWLLEAGIFTDMDSFPHSPPPSTAALLTVPFELSETCFRVLTSSEIIMNLY